MSSPLFILGLLSFHSHQFYLLLCCFHPHSGVQKATREDEIQAGDAAVPLGDAPTRGPSLSSHVVSRLGLPTSHRLSATGVQRGVARQGVRVLGQGSQQLQTGLHPPTVVSELRGQCGCEGVGGEQESSGHLTQTESDEIFVLNECSICMFCLLFVCLPLRCCHSLWSPHLLPLNLQTQTHPHTHSVVFSLSVYVVVYTSAKIMIIKIAIPLKLSLISTIYSLSTILTKEAR